MKNFFKAFLRQFCDFTVILLIICAGLGGASAFMGKDESYIDSIIIFAIVLINALFGAVQEYKAETILGKRAADRPTPLQKKLSETAGVLCILCICACALVFLGGILRGNTLWDTLVLSVSLAVAVVPEGLPAVVTIMLSAGICKFGKMGITARTAASAESMGRIANMFIDKKLIKNKELKAFEKAGIKIFDITEKEKFITLWENGETTAFIGSSHEDAPYMEAADVGGCFNFSKSVYSHAYIIFGSVNGIIEAIKTGRGIYRNLRKTTEYLLSCNIGELFVMLGAVAAGLSSPLLAIHLLTVNLITDCLPALAMGFEPYGNEVMTPMKNEEKELLGKKMIQKIVFEGIVIGSVSLIAFLFGSFIKDVTTGRSMAFCVLCLSQLIHGYDFREKSIFENKMLNIAAVSGICAVAAIVQIPLLSSAFKLTSLTAIQWLDVTLLAVTPFALFEWLKKIKAAALK